MDGVLWKADAPIGDLPEIFALIDRKGLKVAFATNNGTRTPEQYVERMQGFGVAIEPWQVITSSQGVAHLLSQRFPQGGKVFVIGEVGLERALQAKGFELVSAQGETDILAVVMGIDRNINFTKVSEAALLIGLGLPFYATNPDRTFPTPRGEIPGAGAWISVLITASGIEPIYAGKPSPYLLEIARQRLGTEKGETLVVGDRLETDIAGGQAAGCPVAVVLSGVSGEKQAIKWLPAINMIAPDLTALLR